MADIQTDTNVDTREQPQFRIRVNTGRNSTGITFDVTTSMTWSGTVGTYLLDGEEYSVDAALKDLNEQAHQQLDERVTYERTIDTYVPKPPKA